MSTLRLFCLAGAAITLFAITNQIRRSKIKIEDSLFWVVLSGVLLLVAIFPQIAYFFSNLLGFQAMSNFIFVAVIGILVLKEFSNTMQISLLKHKLNELAQEQALSELEMREGERNETPSS